MTTTPTDDAALGTTVREWAVLLTVCGALFLEGADIAMLNVAVPTIARDVGLDEGEAHWLISAYVLGYAGFMLLGGRVADVVGRRRVFLVALGVFVVFSVLGGLADSGWLLVLARFATGVSAAFMTPAGYSIVTTTFAEGSRRSRALAMYGAVGAAGFTLGMVTGGLLASADWRWVFFAPALVGAGLLVTGLRLVRPDRAQDRQPGAFDIPGAATITGGMVALVLAVVELGQGSADATGTVAWIVAAGLIVLFVVIERRATRPLVRLGLLREGLLAHASLAGLLFMGAFFGFQFVLTLYLQELRGWSSLEVGLTFAIMGADLALAPVLAPWLVQRVGNAGAMTAGCAAALASYVLVLRLDGGWTYPDLLPSLLLVALAFALVYGPITGAAAEGIDEDEHGLAGGVLFTAFQFGGALGLSVVTAVLLAGDSAQPQAADHVRALGVPAGAALLALAVAALAWRRSRTTLA